MAVIETESIVLRSFDLSDADRIAVLLTEDHGIVRAVAKGAKRLKSRFGSGLEPLSLVKATYFQKETRELVDLQSVEMIDSAFRFAAEPAFLTQFSYLTDILLALLPPEDPNEKLYRMVKASIFAAGNNPASLTAISVYFEVWLLRLAGFLPSWTECFICGRSLDDEGATQLNAEFHPICVQCAKSGGGDVLTRGTRELAARSRTMAPAEFAASVADRDELSKFSSILRRMIAAAAGQANLDRSLKAGVASGHVAKS